MKTPAYRPLEETLEAVNHIVKALELEEAICAAQSHTWSPEILANYQARCFEYSVAAATMLWSLGDSPEIDKVVERAKETLKRAGFVLVVDDSPKVIN